MLCCASLSIRSRAWSSRRPRPAFGAVASEFDGVAFLQIDIMRAVDVGYDGRIVVDPQQSMELVDDSTEIAMVGPHGDATMFLQVSSTALSGYRHGAWDLMSLAPELATATAEQLEANAADGALEGRASAAE